MKHRSHNIVPIKRRDHVREMRCKRKTRRYSVAEEMRSLETADDQWTRAGMKKRISDFWFRPTKASPSRVERLTTMPRIRQWRNTVLRPRYSMKNCQPRRGEIGSPPTTPSTSSNSAAGPITVRMPPETRKNATLVVASGQPNPCRWRSWRQECAIFAHHSQQCCWFDIKGVWSHIFSSHSKIINAFKNSLSLLSAAHDTAALPIWWRGLVFEIRNSRLIQILTKHITHRTKGEETHWKSVTSVLPTQKERVELIMPFCKK